MNIELGLAFKDTIGYHQNVSVHKLGTLAHLYSYKALIPNPRDSLKTFKNSVGQFLVVLLADFTKKRWMMEDHYVHKSTKSTKLRAVQIRYANLASKKHSKKNP